MKKGTIIVLLVGVLSPLFWWTAYHLLYPIALRTESFIGLAGACTMGMAITCVVCIAHGLDQD